MKFKLFNRRLGVEVIEPRRGSGANIAPGELRFAVYPGLLMENPVGVRGNAKIDGRWKMDDG